MKKDFIYIRICDGMNLGKTKIILNDKCNKIVYEETIVNLNNIKRLATFFGAEYQMLLADTNYCYLVNEKNEVKSFLPLDILERSNTFATVLLGNY